MRFRNGLVLCLLLTSIVGVGCRKALAPNIDRNQAPETWITAAPQDTITIKDAGGKVIGGTQTPTTIPFKFHLYWAGSDPDGSIAGFYYAVVETLPQPPAGGTEIPPLPGPKARDYRFTTRTDSTFIFNVSDAAPDRMHAFYIYAVDDQGKADPTPARVIFNAQDRYPPLPVFTLARGTGKWWVRAGNGRPPVLVDFVHDIADTFSTKTVTQDTVSTLSRLDFRWRSEPVAAGNPAVRYRYKLDEIDFIDADSSVTAVTYNSGVNDRVGAGLKVFTLRAIDVAGAKREVKRRFQFNYMPDTWIAGPDPNSPAFNHVETGSGYHYFDATVPFTRGPGGVAVRMDALPGTLLSPDSVYLMPATRPERKTFIEIYENRIYAHAEFDTVNMNSYVITHSGGLDPDSPYSVKVNAADPVVQKLIGVYGELPPVLTAGPANGSPIGFRANFATSVYPTRQLISFTQTGVYPVFDPSSVLYLGQMSQYWLANSAGQAYMYARSEGGYGVPSGDLDASLNANTIADLVSRCGRDLSCGGVDSLAALRRKVLTFYVDHAPVLQVGVPGFFPNPGAIITSPQISVNLALADSDQYNATQIPKPVPGGHSVTALNRYRLWVHGKNAAGNDTLYDEHAKPPYHNGPAFNVILPSYLVNGPLTFEVEVCDCFDCENSPGTGRCSEPHYFIPVVLNAAPNASTGASSWNTHLGEPGPGSDPGRSTEP